MNARVSLYEVAPGGDVDAAVSGFEDAMEPLRSLEGHQGATLLVARDSGEGDHHHLLGYRRTPAFVRRAGEQAPSRSGGSRWALDTERRSLRSRVGDPLDRRSLPYHPVPMSLGIQLQRCLVIVVQTEAQMGRRLLAASGRLARSVAAKAVK